MKMKTLKFGFLVLFAGLVAFGLKFRPGYDYFDQTWWASVLAMIVGASAIACATLFMKE